MAPDTETKVECRSDLPAMPEVGALPFAAQLPVWAARSWVGAFKSQRNFAAATEHAFARFGLARAGAAIPFCRATAGAAAPAAGGKSVARRQGV